MDNLFSQKLKDIQGYSLEEAERLNSSELYPEHLLLGILRDGNNRAISILNQLHIDVTHLKSVIDDSVKSNYAQSDAEMDSSI
ncbi:MAG: Clp protease N-terminal domain-containing protein, partial [Bacteroidales bacterium]